MKKAVIFDLDGTLALIDKRRAKAARPDGKINWKVFFDPNNIELDEPNWPVIEMFKAMKSLGHRMIIFSGRDSINKQETQAWLAKYGIHRCHLHLPPRSTTPLALWRRRFSPRLQSRLRHL